MARATRNKTGLAELAAAVLNEAESCARFLFDRRSHPDWKGIAAAALQGLAKKDQKVLAELQQAGEGWDAARREHGAAKHHRDRDGWIVAADFLRDAAQSGWRCHPTTHNRPEPEHPAAWQQECVAWVKRASEQLEPAQQRLDAARVAADAATLVLARAENHGAEEWECAAAQRLEARLAQYDAACAANHQQLAAASRDQDCEHAHWKGTSACEVLGKVARAVRDALADDDFLTRPGRKVKLGGVDWTQLGINVQREAARVTVGSELQSRAASKAKDSVPDTAESLREHWIVEWMTARLQPKGRKQSLTQLEMAAKDERSAAAADSEAIPRVPGRRAMWEYLHRGKAVKPPLFTQHGTNGPWSLA